MRMKWTRSRRGAATLFLTCLLSQSVPAFAAELVPSPGKPFLRPPVAATDPASARQTDRLIVKYKASSPDRHATGSSQAEKLSKRAGMTLRHHHAMSGDGQVFALPKRMSRDDVETVARKLAEDPAVEYAVPDLIASPQLIPNDTSYGNQWDFKSPDTEISGINLPPAWELTTGDASLVVAVIDTGIVTHADLQGRILPGYNFISDPVMAGNGVGRSADASDLGDWTVDSSGNTIPSTWHGTHVTGTIAAATNNGAGVAGINWNSKVLPVRVLGKGGGYISDVIDGMRWAAGLSVPGVPANTTPAKVLNLSLGGQGSCSEPMQSAVTEILATGATVVVAAGNSDNDAIHFYPANCNGVIPVAAIGRYGGATFYGNYGSIVKIAAPGGDETYGTANGVLSTLNTGTTSPVPSPSGDTYGYYQGTSMASPHVAGVASLMLSVNPYLSSDQIVGIMQSTARPFPKHSGVIFGDCFNDLCGSGILDAYRAVQAVSLKQTLVNATPVSLLFSVPADGSTPAAQTIQITNPGSGILNWSVTSSVPWLHVTPSSGQDAGTLTVSIDIPPLSAAARPEATLTINASGAANSPLTVPVAVAFLPKQLAPMTVPGIHPALSAVNGKLYAIGGWPGDAYTRIYDPASDTWSNGTPDPTGVDNTDAAVINGKIYIPGGSDLTGNATNRLDIYDPATDQWSSGAKMPKALMWPVVQSANGKLYVFGGQDATAMSTAAYVYDPAQNQWSSLPSSGLYWFQSASGVVDGKIYLYGGFYTSSAPLVFDPATNGYTVLPRANLDRSDLAGTVVGGKPYAIAGYSFATWQNSEYYDPAANAWTFSPLLVSNPRFGHRAAAIGNTVYVLGGWREGTDGSYYLSYSNEAYTVPAPQPENGVCGGSNGQSLTTVPQTGLCAVGTPSTPSSTSWSGPWTWSCSGVNGGASVNCSTYGPFIIPAANVLPTAFLGKQYGVMLSATGGTSPVTWSAPLGGSLPDGLSIDSATGIISGVPLTLQSSSFSLTATDALGYNASKTFTLNVKLPPAMIARNPAKYYIYIQDAFDDCADGEKIKLTGSYMFRGITTSFNRDIKATLSGGYSDDYTTVSGSTLYRGELTITNGTLNVDGLILK